VNDRESPLWPFLLLSLALFAAGEVVLGFVIHSEPPPKFVEVDLSDLQGVKDELPPPGEPSASPAAKPVSTPAPTPQPTPEPTPEPTPTPPPPAATPEFVKPEPSVQPRPSPKPRPRSRAPRHEATTAPGPTQSAQTGRGSPTGKTGGAGGSKGDFIATPHPEYDSTALERRYQGSGAALITYANGQIIAAEMTRSTGVPYLDSRTTAWIKRYWKVKPGVSGRAILPISWRIE
jgi:outer membrane biosynthesis protein TonB